MNREGYANSNNYDATTNSSEPYQEAQLISDEQENSSFQNNYNNTAIIHLDSSAKFGIYQRSSSAGRSSSPPPLSSNQDKHPNFIQRRKSTPSWTLTREVKYIKKDRRKKNVEQMLVVFQNDKNDIGRWIDVSELNCPQLIEEYWIRKKQMKESNLNNANNNGDKQSNPKKTGARAIKEIIGMIPSQEHKYIYVVTYNDSTTEDYKLWKEMRKHYSKQLLKFYESHIDQENFIIAPPSSISPIIQDVPQISQQQSQQQITQPLNQQSQKHYHHQQKQQLSHEDITPDLPQVIESQVQDINDAEKNIEEEKEDKSESNNAIPIFQNPPIAKIQMLQHQVQLQRMTNTPPSQPKEQTKSIRPQRSSQIQLIQQNSLIMSRK